jgi:hypothetical protein
MLLSNESPCFSKKKKLYIRYAYQKINLRVCVHPNDQSSPVVLEEDQVYAHDTGSTAPKPLELLLRAPYETYSCASLRLLFLASCLVFLCSNPTFMRQVGMLSVPE